MNIRRNSWLLFVCLLLYCFFPVSGHAYDAEARLQSITVVSDDNYPPYIFRDSNGVIQGILVDGWKLWENKTGIKVNLIAMDWSKAQEFLLRGNADVIDTIFFTAERANQYDFTKPYATIDVPIFFHKNLGGITDIASLKGFTIGVKAGDACIEILKKQGITSLQEYNSYETIVNAAGHGEIKVFSIDKPPALYYLYKMNFENEFRYSFNLYTGEFHRAVKKGRTDILRIVEDGFALINRTEQDGIEKKWMGEPFVRPAYLRYVLFAFLLAGAFFLVLILFNITLRRTVRSKTSELQDLVNQLRLSEERFRGLADSLPQIVFETNEKGIITFGNRNALDYFGYTESEFDKNLNALQMICPEDRDKAVENIQKVLSGEILGGIEYTAIRKDGSTFPVEIHSKVFSRDNKPIGLRGIIVDLSKRKQAEKERLKLEEDLRQSQKMESIGNLAGGIAHDFNNILSSIIGYTELAIDDVEKGTLLSDNLQEVFTAGKRARDLVKQILAFARQSDEERKPIQVDTIAEEALKLIRSTIPTSIEIKQTIESHSLIIGNPTQLHQIFMNLCTNAAQAMEDAGGILEVCLKDVTHDNESFLTQFNLKPGNYVKVTVSDTGSGIAPDIIDSIFEPYFTTKSVSKGTGLGLATVHGIVETYGGKITVDSELGKGTIFSIYLPITKKSEDYRPYEEEKLPSGTERILFVDDELPIANMGSQILERLGYQVAVRTSSVEALELFRSKPNDFDLAITDMTMPNMTGDELAIELMRIRSDIPVILCTGYSKKISDESAAQIGIKAFAYKPVVKANLAKTVRKVLDEAKAKSCA